VCRAAYFYTTTVEHRRPRHITPLSSFAIGALLPNDWTDLSARPVSSASPLTGQNHEAVFWLTNLLVYILWLEAIGPKDVLCYSFTVYERRPDNWALLIPAQTVQLL